MSRDPSPVRSCDAVSPPHTYTTFCANHPTSSSSSGGGGGSSLSLSGPSQRPKLPSSSGGLCCAFFPLSLALFAAAAVRTVKMTGARTHRARSCDGRTDGRTKRRPDGQMMKKKPGHMAPLWRNGALIPKRAHGSPEESTGSIGCRDLAIKNDEF